MGQFPLVRHMLAAVYNNSFMCTAPNHRDLTWEEVVFHDSQSEGQLVIAEKILCGHPAFINLMSSGEVEDQHLPAVLVAVVNTYAHSLGIL